MILQEGLNSSYDSC